MTLSELDEHADTIQMASGQSSAAAVLAVKAESKTWAKSCAIMVGDLGTGPIFGGKTMRDTGGIDIDMKLVVYKTVDASPWIGFSLSFYLGNDNEDNGFGMCHRGE